MSAPKPPLEPWDHAQNAPARRKRVASLPNRARVEMAIALIQPVVISLAERRPAGFSGWEADSAKMNLQEALVRMRVTVEKWQRVEERAKS